MKFQNRRELIKHLNTTNTKIVAEVGVREGHFSRFILNNTEIEKLYAIDPWEYNIECVEPEAAFEKCQEFLNPFGERVEMVKGYSPQVCVDFGDESLDFVYIDGLHSYEAVSEDIKGWYPKVKSGAIMAGHDYSQRDWPGVVRAVNEFITNTGLELNLTGTNSPDYEIEHDGRQPSWWVIKK